MKVVMKRNSIGSLIISVAFLLFISPLKLSAQALEHRYSFNSAAGSTYAIDSVGGPSWDGYLVGNAYITNDMVVLPGGGTSSSPAGYVQLPNGIVSNDASISVECWLTDNGGLVWAEAWCFGDSAAGPGNPPSNGTAYISLIPHSGTSGPGTDFRGTFNLTGGDEEDVYDTLLGGETMPTNQECYTVLTYDINNSNAMLYLNGVLAGTATIPTNLAPANYGKTYNNWIGRDEYSGDPMFQGSVDELRIWNGAVSPLYIALSLIAGPDTVVTSITPLSVTVTAANTGIVGTETEQAWVTANFDQFSGVNVTASATNWSSSNPKVLSVNSSGMITGLSGGTATVSATLGGMTGTSAVITVAITKPTITQEPVSATNFVGQTAVFSIQVLGGQLSYQWSEGSTAIPGATNSTLTLPDVTLANAGNYKVVVSNALGSTNSAVVSLTVQAPTLVHRWSFNDPAGSTTDLDSVGGADGTNMGNAYIDVTNGTVVLPDTTTISTDPGASYVQLPPGILANLNSATIEVWATDNGPRTWAEIFCFGGSTEGFNDINNETNYISFIPTSEPGDMRAAFRLLNEEDVIYTNTPMPTNVEKDVALTYDNTTTTAILYLSGKQAAINTNITITPADLGNTYNNYLGRDEWPDPIFHGSIDELRIYAGPLTPTDVVNNHAGGPNKLVAPGTANQTAIAIALSGKNIVLTWPQGSLLQATSVSGPWTTNTAAVSPCPVPATNTAQFFKFVAP
jgi:hypothetical protein